MAFPCSGLVTKIVGATSQRTCRQICRCFVTRKGFTTNPLNSRPSLHRSIRSMKTAREGDVRLKAVTDEVYDGTFGPWKIEPEDELEVLLYRIGITISAVSLGLGTAASFLPEGSYLETASNPLSVTGAAGLGLSLYLIHIYVAPLKRFLQLLWGAGVLGGTWLMVSQSEPLASYVVGHPEAIWLVGPLFAAVTGVAFKEGLCYGKPEAAALFLLVPTIMLGHLSGGIPDDALHLLMGVFALLYGWFAARKYTQPVKDDIGDKSVFEFQKLSREEQERLLKDVNFEE